MTKDQIKENTSVLQLAKKLGHDVYNKKMYSIYNKERTPSLSLSKSFFYDFSSGKGGDIFTFYADSEGIDLKANFKEVVTEVAKLFGLEFNESSLKKAYRDPMHKLDYKANKDSHLIDGTRFSDIYDFFLNINPLRERGQGFMCNRGFDTYQLQNHRIGQVIDSYKTYKATDQLLRNNFALDRLTESGLYNQNQKFKGFGGNLIIPYINPVTSKIESLQFRDLLKRDKYPRYQFLKGIKQPIYYAKKSIIRSQKVGITEGVLDALSLEKLGKFDTIISLGSANNLKKITIDMLERWASDEYRISILFDNDRAGIEGTKALQAELANWSIRSISFDWTRYPKTITDINDILKSKTK